MKRINNNLAEEFNILFVVPTLNSYKELPVLLESIKEQTFDRWEILFVDGRSNSKHKKYLKDYSASESRIKIINQSNDNPGIYGAMNIGFSYAKKNQWIFFWGSDDWAPSNKILENISQLIKNLSISNKLPDLIFFQGQYVKKNNLSKGRKSLINLPNRIITGNELKRNIFLGKIPPHQSTLFGPGIRSKKFIYNSAYKMAADLDYFLSISKVPDIKCLANPLNVVNILDGGVSHNRTFLRISEVWKAYWNIFRFKAIFPFSLRYLRKILLKFKL